MDFKFKRYKIRHDRKDYYVFVPELIKDNLWINTLNDDWWGGPFLTGSVRAMRVISAGFALLGCNPHAILYLQIRGDLIPEGYTYDIENGNYDVLFRTNRIQIKDKDWKEIRAKMKKTKWTRYTFRFNEEHIRKYFEKDILSLEKIKWNKIMQNAGAKIWLSTGTFFCSYPRSVYRRCSIDMWDYIKEGLESGDIGGYINEYSGSWIADHIGNIACGSSYRRKKYSYDQPGVGLNLEIYDIHIANRSLKEKDKLVKCDRKIL